MRSPLTPPSPAQTKASLSLGGRGSPPSTRPASGTRVLKLAPMGAPLVGALVPHRAAAFVAAGRPPGPPYVMTIFVRVTVVVALLRSPPARFIHGTAGEPSTKCGVVPGRSGRPSAPQAHGMARQIRGNPPPSQPPAALPKPTVAPSFRPFGDPLFGGRPRMQL